MLQGFDDSTVGLFTAFAPFHDRQLTCAIVAREKQLHIRGLSSYALERPSNVLSYIRNNRVVKVLMSQDDRTIYAFGTNSANHRIAVFKIEVQRLEDDDSVKLIANLPGLSHGDEFTAALSTNKQDHYILVSTLLGDIYKVRLVD